MDEPNAQAKSASYRLAVEDTDFLLRDEMRAIRFALEYAKAEFSLRDWGIRSTIIVFGGARVPSRSRRSWRCRRLARRRRRPRRTAAGPLGLLSGRARLRPHRLRARRRLRPQEQVARQRHRHRRRPGIMEAANRGAFDAGAPSIGFNITLPVEQKPNPYITPELSFRFHYFAMRKMHLAMRANALAIFPGGFGTMDELFELLTLQQTSKAPPAPIVLFGEDYWRRIVNFDALLEEGMISPADLELFEYAETAEEGWALLTRRGLKAHTPNNQRPPQTGR